MNEARLLRIAQAPLRLSRGALLAAALLGAITTNAVAQQILLADDFGGSALDTSSWVWGATNSLGSASVAGGNLSLTYGATNGGRSALLSHNTNMNPFAGPMSITLNDIDTSLMDPTTTGSVALYTGIGRLPTDTGGMATSDRASTYSAGGGGYATGGALGFSLLKYDGNVNRLQVLDSGQGTATSTMFTMSTMPTDVVFNIDGTTLTWSIELFGATFTNVPGGTTVDPAKTSATGSFANLTEAGLLVNEEAISRLFLGVNTNSSADMPPTGVVGSITAFSSVPEPSTYAAIFGGIAALTVVLRRRKLMA